MPSASSSVFSPDVPIPLGNPRQRGYVPDARTIGFQPATFNVGGQSGAVIPSLPWLDTRTHAPFNPLAPAAAPAQNYRPAGYGVQSTQKSNPAIARALQDAYNGLNTTPAATTVTTTQKSPAQASRIGALASGSAAQKPVKDQSISEFVQELIASKPKNQAALRQEQAAIDRTYTGGPGSLESDLADTRTRRARAVRAATASALNRARRENNVNRMMGGNSSYLDRAYGDNLGRILTEQALQNSGLEREDLQYLQGQRMGLLGQRRNLGQQYLDDILMPNRTLNALQGQEQDLVAGIGNLEDANTYYDYLTPERAFALRMSGLDMIDRLEGMQQPVPWSVPGEGPYMEPGYDEPLYYPVAAPAAAPAPVAGPSVADHPSYQFLDSLARQSVYNPSLYGSTAVPTDYLANLNFV